MTRDQVIMCPPDNTTPDEAVLDTEHVGILIRVSHTDVCELDVEILVHGVQSATDGEIILQLHNHVLTHQGLEERVEQHDVAAVKLLYWCLEITCCLFNGSIWDTRTI